MKKLIKKFINWRQERINSNNRKLLTNSRPTLICSNCCGGILYHWLGLRFQSPFINLYMDNEDFLTAMENFDEFINGEIVEDKTNDKQFPVGIGVHGEKIYFMHYPDFSTAIAKWKERRKRIDKNNMAVMLTNFGCHDNRQVSIGGGGNSSIIQRFNNLPFKNKVAFSAKKIDSPYFVFLRGYSKVAKTQNIWATKDLNGKRFIDQFDYVSFI